MLSYPPFNCQSASRCGSGWDHGSLNAPELARRAEQAGACLVTVHGRTRQQFYKGNADWSAIRAVRHAIAIPLVANGDIASAADARACLAQSGADAVMIGRAAMGRAWLPGAVGAALARGTSTIIRPDAAARLDMLAAHYTWLLTHFGKEAGVRHARKHLASAMDDHLGRGSRRRRGCGYDAAGRDSNNQYSQTM